MKTILILSFATLFGTTLKSQTTEKGTLFTGLSSQLSFPGANLASLSYGTTKFYSNDPTFIESDPATSFSTNLAPRLGYFLIDNFATGLNFSYAYQHLKSADKTFTENQSTILFGPFVRYYYPLNKFLIYIEAQAAWGQAHYKSVSTTDGLLGFNSDYKTRAFMSNLNIGLSLAIAEKSFIDLGIGYSIQQNWIPSSIYEEYTLSKGAHLSIGFSFLFGKSE